jgi:tRNA pseudouridine38-40 synthase
VGQQITVTGAGRTDAGVHATGQVIAFDVEWTHPDEVLLRALNALLPDDIALQSLVRAPGFHPRFDAVARLYRYTVIHAEQRQPLWGRYAWRVWGALDTALLDQTAALLLGEHDFASFGNPPKGTNTVRRIDCSRWQVEAEGFGQRLVYTVEGTAFLHRMVRRMVGTQIDVARGQMSQADFEAIFAAADLSHKGTLAPPQGLVLARVRY